VANGKHEWKLLKLDNYSDKVAMVSNPEDRVGIRKKYRNNSPYMNYQINFIAPGTYYVWLRMLGLKRSSNSVHIGLNDNPVKSGSNITVPVTGEYAWTNGMETPHRDNCCGIAYAHFVDG
jgi:hypothetical protein